MAKKKKETMDVQEEIETTSVIGPLPEEKIKDKVIATFARERVLAEDKNAAHELYEQSRFGEPKENKINYSLVEALYLLEKGKMEISEGKKKLNPEEFIKRARKVEPNFWIRYCVFRDMRSRGYIVKTALKFGADFRVYDRGVKPGEDHARWVIFPIHEGDTLTWYEFAAKNRVAHSTRKRLLLAIVDEENSVTFYECRWLRP
jgi:tRNA-intron endonuclease